MTFSDDESDVTDLSVTNLSVRCRDWLSFSHYLLTLFSDDRSNVPDACVHLLQEATISELVGVNACLEREVGELEEERRRLKAHLKFNAKHRNQIELDLALTPEQLVAVDAFIARLKTADHDIAKHKVIVAGFCSQSRAACC